MSINMLGLKVWHIVAGLVTQAVPLVPSIAQERSAVEKIQHPSSMSPSDLSRCRILLTIDIAFLLSELAIRVKPPFSTFSVLHLLYQHGSNGNNSHLTMTTTMSLQSLLWHFPPSPPNTLRPKSRMNALVSRYGILRVLSQMSLISRYKI